MKNLKVPNTFFTYCVLSQDSAQSRTVKCNDVLVSITGKNYPKFKFITDLCYNKKRILIEFDDIGSNIPKDSQEYLSQKIDEFLMFLEENKGEDINIVIHCLAGMSRSTAFASGMLAYFSKNLEEFENSIAILKNHIEFDKRKFMPNPFIINLFELKTNKDYIHRILLNQAPHFVTWVKYWSK